jgi:hypothetical protein
MNFEDINIKDLQDMHEKTQQGSCDPQYIVTTCQECGVSFTLVWDRWVISWVII